MVDLEAGNPTGSYDFGSPHLFTDGMKSLYTAKGPLNTEASITHVLTEPPIFETKTSAIVFKLDSLSITGFPVPTTRSPQKKMAFVEGT